MLLKRKSSVINDYKLVSSYYIINDIEDPVTQTLTL